MTCLPSVASDPRTTGEWICVDRSERDGVIRDDVVVCVEIRREAGSREAGSREAGSREGLRQHLERGLHNGLGVNVGVALVDEGALAESANLNREGKPRRLLDRRYAN